MSHIFMMFIFKIEVKLTGSWKHNRKSSTGSGVWVLTNQSTLFGHTTVLQFFFFNNSACKSITATQNKITFLKRGIICLLDIENARNKVWLFWVTRSWFLKETLLFFLAHHTPSAIWGHHIREKADILTKLCNSGQNNSDEWIAPQVRGKICVFDFLGFEPSLLIADSNRQAVKQTVH